MSEHSSIAVPSLANAPEVANNRSSARGTYTSIHEIYPLQNDSIQLKLAVGTHDDPLEHEADAMADKVMRMPEQNFIQRKCPECAEEEMVQRKPITSFIQTKGAQGGLEASESVSNSINSSRGKGNDLSVSTKSFMESRFGTDFSSVNIHTGGEAVQMNRELSAKAFTVGNDIYFNEGQYRPDSSEGKHLLAHELTHTIQQGQLDLFNIQKQDDDIISESEVMRDRFRQDRRRDLHRIIECNTFHKIRNDCPVSTGVRLADVIARMRTRVAGNQSCIRFFTDRFNINPDIMFDPARRPSITFVPSLTVSGQTRCPEPTCASPIPSVAIGNICNSPLLDRVIMHELTHYAHCYRRWGDVGDEATSEQASTICMGTVQQALDAARRTTIVQPKLITHRPDNSLEHEADAMADTIMRMPQRNFLQRKCAACEEEDQVQRKPMASLMQKKGTQGGLVASDTISNQINASRGKGNDLSGLAKSFMESRFGNDFSKVNIHTGGDAAQMNRELNAKAFTVGNDIYFNDGQYNPNSNEGKHLLAHELVHTMQQRLTKVNVQRQFDIGGLSKTSVDISTLSDLELMERLYKIQKRLESFNSCTPESAALIFESRQLEAELNIRSGKTFSPEAIDKLKKYHTGNAAKAKKDEAHDSCIVALNKGVSILHGRTSKELKTTPETIEKTMKGMEGIGLINEKVEINFSDRKGRPTTGSAFPAKLRTSIWDTLISLSNNDTGWIVFGLSLMDGNHSVTLTLDNNNASSPHVYWSDQWGSKGGWKEYNRTELDNEVASLIQGWWNTQAEGRKFNTVVRIWRLKPYK